MSNSTKARGPSAAAIAAAVTRYKFRAREPHEDEAAYLAALIDHVATRDLSAGHELRLGKPQAEWTADEALAFGARMSALPGPRETFTEGVRAFHVIRDKGPYPATELCLREIASRGLGGVVARRQTDPAWEIPVFVTVLLTTGELLTTVVGRADRIALLKTMVQTEPVFGFALVFDAWIHGVQKDAGTASKTEAILAQIGTRDMRVMRTRPYRRAPDGRVTFDDPLPDVNMRTAEDVNDPYASVFVSVPMPTGRPS